MVSSDDAWAAHVERSWIAGDEIGSTTTIFPNYKKGRTKVDREQFLTGANFRESQTLASVNAEISGPPELELLPRSNPMETLEKDHKQV